MNKLDEVLYHLNCMCTDGSCIFRPSDMKDMVTNGGCGKGGRLERHHVTYEPVKISNLCRKCHKMITELNTMCSQSTEPFHKLSNAERLTLWKAFLVR